MPYKLRKDEAPADGLKRILEEQLSAAIEQLQSAQDVNLSIYEARKSLKKARSVLRLIASPLGPVYVEENRRMREVARRFGPQRDTHVSLELLDKFAAGYKRKTVLDAPRQALLMKQLALQQETNREAVDSLTAIRRRMEDWPTLPVTDELLQAEIQKTHKHSRQAFDKATKSRSAEDFHEFRKSVKRELNQTRVTGAPGLEDLKELAKMLGDHHNLAVLLDTVENASGRFKAMIRRQMKELESRIVSCYRLSFDKVWQT